VKSKNGVFPVDEAGDLPLVYDGLSCEFTDSEMAFRPVDLKPSDWVASQSSTLSDALSNSFSPDYVKTLPALLAKVSKHYLEAFFDAFEALLKRAIRDELYLDLFAIYLYFLSGLDGFITFAAHGKAFRSPVIYNREHCVFTKLPSQIHCFRRLFFDIALAKSQEVCFEILVYCAKRSPWLFAEQVMRFLMDLPHVNLDLFCLPSVMSSLVASAHSFRAVYL
jgi:hypothetical protein